MNGRVAKRQRRDGTRRWKRTVVIPVDDSTNYAFNKEFYRERRNHTVTAKVDILGYQIIGYVTAKKGSAEVHNPKDMFDTIEEATAKMPRIGRKDYEVRAVIKKPLRGMRQAPRVYETVEDENRNPVRIPVR